MTCIYGLQVLQLTPSISVCEYMYCDVHDILDWQALIIMKSVFAIIAIFRVLQFLNGCCNHSPRPTQHASSLIVDRKWREGKRERHRQMYIFYRYTQKQRDADRSTEASMPLSQ